MKTLLLILLFSSSIKTEEKKVLILEPLKADTRIIKMAVENREKYLSLPESKRKLMRKWIYR